MPTAASSSSSDEDEVHASQRGNGGQVPSSSSSAAAGGPSSAKKPILPPKKRAAEKTAEDTKRSGKGRARSHSLPSEASSEEDKSESSEEEEEEDGSATKKKTKRSDRKDEPPPPFRGKSSRYIGVDYNKHTKKYEARFVFQGRIHHLGLFKDEVEAAKAYDEAVFLNRGPDAPRNFEYNGVPPTHRSSAYRGVNFDKRSKKWKASMRVDGKSTYFGLFKSEKAAAKVYDREALKYRGLDAKLNFPDAPYVKEFKEKLLESKEDGTSDAAGSSTVPKTVRRKQGKNEAEKHLEDD